MKKSIFILALLLILPLASAEIFLSNQPSDLYNVGDSLDLQVTIKANAEINSFFTAGLKCSEGVVELYKQPIKLNADEQKAIPLKITLDPNLIPGTTGECFLTFSYSQDNLISSSFTITKEIKVSFLVDSLVPLPGEEIKVEGSAKKSNGQLLDGVVELFFNDLEGLESSSIQNGEFSLSIKVPKDTPAKGYVLTSRVYEKNSKGDILNEGTHTQNITVKQQVKSIDVAIQNPSITPDQPLIYTVNLYDQTENQIEKEVSVEIFNSQREVLERSVVISGDSQTLNLPTDSLPGLWQIKASINNLSKERTITIEELEQITYTLTNKTLKIKNTGNVQYIKPVEINIGDVDEIKELSLVVGEEVSFELSAPTGEYSITINDGKSQQDLGSVSLTGNAVGIKEPGQSGSSSKIVIWMIMILIIIFALVLLSKRMMNKGYLSSLKTLISRIKPSGNNKFPPALINSGKKQEVMALALYVKNLAELESSKNESALKAIDHTIIKAKEGGARTHQEGNYTILIYPMDNDDIPLLSVQAGKMVEAHLNSFNDNNNQKINFGLGLHIGQIIAETKSENKLRFTALGNLMTIVKRIASHSGKEINLSEPAHKRLVGKIKSKHLPEKNVWLVTEMPRRGQYENFIKVFVKRQENELKEKNHVINEKQLSKEESKKEDEKVSRNFRKLN